MPLPNVSGTLVCDVDPSQNTWQDAARTTVADEDGELVRSIQYATGAYLVAPSDGTRPELKVSGDLRWLRFTAGSATRLVDATFSVSKPHTVFVVARYGGTNQVVYDSAGASSRAYHIASISNGGCIQYGQDNGVNSVLSLVAGSPGVPISVSAARRSGTIYEVFHAGTRNQGTEDVDTWTGLTLGTSYSAGAAFTGDIYRVVIYDGALTDAEINTVGLYLRAEYEAVWMDAGTLSTAALATDRRGDYIRVAGGGENSAIEQSCLAGAKISGYYHFDGLDTSDLVTTATFAVVENGTTASTTHFTAAESKHAGVGICYSDADNNYLAMISPAASAIGERGFQLVKQVSGVETVLDTEVVAGLALDTPYTIKMWRDATHVYARLLNAAGTVLSDLSAADTSLTTGETAVHGFAARHQLFDLTVGAGEPTIEVSGPVAGAIYLVGDSIPVAWSSQETSGTVDVLLSVDNGATYPLTIVEGTTDDYAYAFTALADHVGAQVKVKVADAADAMVFGESDAFVVATTEPGVGGAWKRHAKRFAIKAGFRVSP